MNKFSLPGLFVVAALLVACESPRQAVPAEDPRPEPAPPAETASQPGLLLDQEERYRRMIADWLYDGLRALREDRLLTPPESSAHAWFSRVLALEPDNELALEGIQDIVARYLQLADIASRQGQFDNAETFLRRAAQVNPSHDGIALSREHLSMERQRTHSVTLLDGRELANRAESLVDRLQELARTVREKDMFVLITTPNDEQGRWVYSQMQAAFDREEYRLRGDIEIGQQPSVRLLFPPNAQRSQDVSLLSPLPESFQHQFPDLRATIHKFG